MGRARAQRGRIRPRHPGPVAPDVPLHRHPALGAPAVAGHQQRPVLEGHRPPLPADGLRHAGHRRSRLSCWHSPSSAPRRRSPSGTATPTPGLSFLLAAAGLAVGRRGGRRGRRDPGVRARARRGDRPLVAVAVADGGAPAPGQRAGRRPAGCGVVGADRAPPHRTRSARQRAATAGVAGHDDRAGADQARQRPARGQDADRRGPRRRQERAVELRNVVRGIAPTILSDRGLDAALSSVVQRSELRVPTTLDLHLPRRLPDEVEACRLLRRRRGVDQHRQARERHPGGGHRAARRIGEPVARLDIRQRPRRRRR